MQLPNDKVLLKVIIGAVLAATGIILLELWFSVFGEAFFAKALISCAVVAVAAGILKAINSDMGEDKDKNLFN
jgi:hypothetical protein